MRIGVRYLAQLRQAAGRAGDEIEVEEGSTVRAMLARLATVRPEVRVRLLDAEGHVQKTLLIFVGDEQVRVEHILHGGEEITLMTPIAGGSG